MYLVSSEISKRLPRIADSLVLGLIPAAFVALFSDRNRVSMPVDWFVRTLGMGLVSILLALLLERTQYNHWAPYLWLEVISAALAVSYAGGLICCRRSVLFRQ